MVRVTHTENMSGGVKALIQRMEELKKKRVLVGVPSNKAARGENEEEITNAQLVFNHTNGIRTEPMREEMEKEQQRGTKYSVALQMYTHAHGSAMLQVPPRPIIEPALKSQMEIIAKRLSQMAVAGLDGKNISKEADTLGTFASKTVQGWFTNPQNGWAPNAPSTIRKKKSNKPLVDTGELRDSITYVVED